MKSTNNENNFGVDQNQIASLFGSEEIYLMGDICDETVNPAIIKFITLINMRANLIEKPPLNLFISTYGGYIHSMFSIYDLIKNYREEIPISTIGVGKVMSAGVPLLASGTKGIRAVTSNCRIMIHEVSGGAIGTTTDIQKSLEEQIYNQRAYMKALVKDTKFTLKEIKDIYNSKHDTYFTAKEAVKYGIADVII